MLVVCELESCTALSEATVERLEDLVDAVLDREDVPGATSESTHVCSKALSDAELAFITAVLTEETDPDRELVEDETDLGLLGLLWLSASLEGDGVSLECLEEFDE
jgi:hypothetical protein